MSSRTAKPIDVVAMLLIKGDRILVAQRVVKGSDRKLWEFPGGKVQNHESFEEALAREIHEELEMEVRAKEHFMSVTDLLQKVTLHTFFCQHLSGEPKLNVHEAVSWVTIEALHDLDMFPLDIEIAKALNHQFNSPQ